MRLHPRCLARVLAAAGGYFWEPCSICGKPFAGFEWGETLDLPRREGACSGEGTCSRRSCRRATIRRNTRAAKEQT